MSAYLTDATDIGSGHTATYSPDDNKLRLYPAHRLNADEYARVKAAGFKWAPRQELFVAPMWTPQREDLLIEMCGEIGDEDTSLIDRAETRADRFDGYSERRAADANSARDAVNRIADGIPLGQPILIGHHSERHARRDAERIENGMRKAVQMWRTSQYWTDRAAGALRHAKYKELPHVRARRIKTIEADRRRLERTIAESAAKLKMWSVDGMTLEMARKVANYANPGVCRQQGEGRTGYWTAYDVLQPDGERDAACPSMTVEQVQEAAKRAYTAGTEHRRRWIEHYDNRLAYEKAMLAEQGASDLIAPKPRTKSAKASLPLVNYRAPEGLDIISPYRSEPMRLSQIEMTSAEYSAINKDYKSTGIVGHSHRVRTCMRRSSLHCVFLTDSKTHTALAAAEPPQPVARTPRTFAHEAEPVREAPKDDGDFKAMQNALRNGVAVQVVSAPQLFPTPADIARQVVELADIEAGHAVLEPSAGTGALLSALPTVRPHGYVTAVEINATLARNLEPLADDVHCADFLMCNGNLGKFDRIVMNPPFENASDIRHIEHARHFLKPDGVLVAICANGPRQRARLMPIAREWIDLPAGSFKASGTNVNAAIVVIEGGAHV